MTELLVDDRWIGPHGIGRFADEVITRLPGVRRLGPIGHHLSPFDPFRLHRRLRQLRPAAYFSPGFNPPWRSPVPLVFCIHDLMHLDQPGESSLAKRAYYRWVVRPAGTRAFRVVTVSAFSRRRILEWSGWPAEHVVVAPNGVGPPFGPDGRRAQARRAYLLYVGAHYPHKNVDRLLEAFGRSGLAGRVDLQLTGQPTAGERAILRRHRLDEAVTYLGRLDADALAQHYRGALALVCPSLCEGFGLPALEAMACGTAVIASNAGALPEVVGEAGIQVDPFDVEALAEAMRRLVDDAAARQSLAEAGLRRAARFNWDRTARIIGDVLAEAICAEAAAATR